MATVIGCLDRAMRAFGGAPTYWLTDNERTVTIDHVAGVPVRHPEMVAIGGHYGVTIATCVPADPESKGGSEATVRVAKADLVPTDANLRGGYTSWGELIDACDAWMAEINGREHRVTRRAPVEMLAEEQQRLHRLPEACGCRKLCRGWLGGISVLIDESVTAGRSHDLEASIWLVWWIGGDGWSLVE